MPRGTNAEPFRIRDYTAAAAQLEVTAQRLTELLATLDRTIGSTNLAQLSAQLSPAIEQAQTGARKTVDYALWRGILLIVVALVAALVYRYLSARLVPTTRSKTQAP